MQTIDFATEFKNLYRAKKKVEEVDADRAVYLCVAGQGAPGGEAFAQAIEALYSVAYTLKFELKSAQVVDFKVPKLECLWDVTDPGGTPRDQWKWRLLLRVPESVTGSQIRHAKKTVRDRKGLDTSAVSRRSWKEGKALQLMHLGPYDELHRSYEAVTREAERLGLRVRGPAHDVYLSDPRRVAPAKLKTIVRMPVSHPRPAKAYGSSEKGV